MLLTEAHKMSRPAPLPLPKITPRQQRALTALVSGETIADAAKAAKSSRETVSRWMHNDPDFIAALNDAREHAWSGQLDRLRTLGTKALDVVEDSLTSGSEGARLRAAALVLQTLKIDDGDASPLRPRQGPRSPASVRWIWDYERRKAQQESVE